MEENVYNNCIWYYIYTLLLLYISTSIINKSIYRERYLYSRIYICCLLVQMGCTPLIFAVTLVTRHAKGGGRPCIMWCDGWFVLQDCRLKQKTP